MAPLQFTDVQSRPTEFLAVTSLTLDEFQQIRAVIAPLDPGHHGEDLLKRRRAPGQEDLPSSPALGHGEGRSFCSPSGLSGARASKAQASSSAYGGATREIAAPPTDPGPPPFVRLRSLGPPPSAVH